MTPQVKTLLTHLQNHGSISAAEAGTVYRIRSLPRRISDLKELGHNITRELKVDPTGQRYARYTLVPPKPLAVGSEIEIVSIDGDKYGTPAQRGTIYKVGDRALVTDITDDHRVYASFLKGYWYVAVSDLKVIA